MSTTRLLGGISIGSVVLVHLSLSFYSLPFAISRGAVGAGMLLSLPIPSSHKIGCAVAVEEMLQHLGAWPHGLQLVGQCGVAGEPAGLGSPACPPLH